MELSSAPNGLKFKFSGCRRTYTIADVVDILPHDAERLIIDEDGIVLRTNKSQEITPLAIKAKHLKINDEFSHSVPLNLIPHGINENFVISKVSVVDKGQFDRIYYINPHTNQLSFIEGDIEVQLSHDFLR